MKICKLIDGIVFEWKDDAIAFSEEHVYQLLE